MVSNKVQQKSENRCGNHGDSEETPFFELGKELGEAVNAGRK
jgi:hypothetical protein